LILLCSFVLSVVKVESERCAFIVVVIQFIILEIVI